MDNKRASRFHVIPILAVIITLIITATSPGWASAQTFDLLIRGGLLLDGTGTSATRGDVAIRGDRIAALGVLDPAATATRVLNANGCFVAPGFIDVHTHCEGDLLTTQGALAENFLRMGVTSVITGNCGSSELHLKESFTSYTKAGLGLNVGSLVGHGSVRSHVLGNVNRDPSTTELLAMRNLVAQGMKDGAFGLSSGLIYNPGKFAKTWEIASLAREVARYGGLYATHMRSEGTDIEDSIFEALAIGRAAGCPVEISHFKMTSPSRHGETTKTIALVEEARRAGQDVTVDQYVYTASATTINIMLPDWASEGTSAEVRARLRDPITRARIRNELIASRKPGRTSLDYAHVSFFRPDPRANGKSILDLARMWKHDDSWDAQGEVVLDIITSGGASMVFHSIAEEDVENILQYPYTMFASDSGVREFGRGVPHPRGYGNNARVLGRYVRGAGLLTVAEAVRKMTSLPAKKFGLADRGELRVGAIADVIVFDMDKVNDPATYDHPHAYAEGFGDIIVSGEPVIADGKITGSRPGKILYGPGRDKNPGPDTP